MIAGGAVFENNDTIFVSRAARSIGGGARKFLMTGAVQIEHEQRHAGFRTH